MNKPIAIWTKDQADLWHGASENIQRAWNNYAQQCFDKQMDAYFTENGVKNPMTAHQWAPPLTFEEWLKLWSTRG